MEYRRPLLNDFEQMVILQNKNLDTTLSQQQLADGFLSTAFTVEQFKMMDHQLCVIVCVDAGNVCGYLCASTIELNQSFPLQAAMLDYCSQCTYNEIPLLSYRSFIATPICIDASYRGKGIYLELCKHLATHIPIEYELALTFIASKNKRSLEANKKIGTESINQFERNGQIFEILVCPMQKFRNQFIFKG